jgi:hypothetical protein
MRGVPQILVAAFVVAGLCGALLSCGGGDDETTTGEGSGSRPKAEEIASCAEEAGFDPTISSGTEPGATAVDLTTRTATIVVQVFESEDDAAAYESAAGLDQEQVGSAVILGGAIPPQEREQIKACISG